MESGDGEEVLDAEAPKVEAEGVVLDVAGEKGLEEGGALGTFFLEEVEEALLEVKPVQGDRKALFCRPVDDRLHDGKVRGDGAKAPCDR